MISGDVFYFKSFGWFSPAAQIVLISVLFVITTALYYREYQKTGRVSKHYPPKTALLFAPIYEEIIFRGFILILLSSLYSVGISIAISSALFGLWHFKNIFWVPKRELIYQMAYTGIIFGPIASILMVTTGTIWPAVILHYINNILAPFSRQLPKK